MRPTARRSSLATSPNISRTVCPVFKSSEKPKRDTYIFSLPFAEYRELTLKLGNRAGDFWSLYNDWKSQSLFSLLSGPIDELPQVCKAHSLHVIKDN